LPRWWVFLSTVPPTAGLVAKFFSVAHMATLFGIVMLTHSVGGFLGAWLGSKAFEATGNLDWLWYAAIVLPSCWRWLRRCAAAP
jgi:hypothetical protein